MAKTDLDIKERAAVHVVDNQTGAFGFDSSTMNQVDMALIQKDLESKYDRVFVVVAHDRNPKNNEVVKALKEAAARFGTVDMYVHMHTNMSAGTLAQVPYEAFDEALTPKERSHLRFLYSMGCGDGNEASAVAAMHLGFRTFLGHRGNRSGSPLVTYTALKHWLAGEQTVSRAADQSYANVKACLPQTGQELIDHWDSLKGWAIAAAVCAKSSEASVKKTATEILACTAGKAPAGAIAFAEIAQHTAQCMPELTNLVRANTFEIGTLLGNSAWDVNEAFPARYAKNADSEMVGQYVNGMVSTLVKDAEPVVYGADITFDALPRRHFSSRAESVRRMAKIVKTTKNPELAMKAAYFLVHFKATDEIGRLIRDRRIPESRREDLFEVFIAANAFSGHELREIALGRSSLLRLVEPAHREILIGGTFKKLIESRMLNDEELLSIIQGTSPFLHGTEYRHDQLTFFKKEAWMAYARVAGMTMAERKDIIADKNPKIDVIRNQPDVMYEVKIEIFGGLLKDDAFTPDELKDIFNKQGPYVTGMSDDLLYYIRDEALVYLMERNLQEAVPLMKKILLNAFEESGNEKSGVFDSVIFKIDGDDMWSLFADEVYHALTNEPKEKRYYLSDPRGRLVTLLQSEDFFSQICRRIIKENSKTSLKRAAAVYLYDNEKMGDADFVRIVGKPRSDIRTGNFYSNAYEHE